MAILNQSAAARAAGVSRSTIVRFIRTGKLSATTSDQGERCVDTAELLRVFGSLKQGESAEDAGLIHPASVTHDPLVQVLRDQVRQLEEQVRRGQARESQLHEREDRLIALLADEQRSRHDLEMRLLPSPAPASGKSLRLRILIAVLLAVIVAATAYYQDYLRAALG